MKQLPPTLHQMSQKGASDEELQFIFDAMVEAEARGTHFLNIYNWKDSGVYFGRERAVADQQLSRWRAKVGPALGFELSAGAWIEREEN